jgi:apurinic endonuclease APN1
MSAAETSSNRLRVRSILSRLSTTETASLKKLLPKGVITDKSIKDLGNVSYPSALLNALPKDECYCLMGHIAEGMLRLPADDITLDNLFEKVKEFYPGFDEAAEAKVTKSKTTQPFLDKLVATREELEGLFEGAPTFEPTVSSSKAPHVEGHPDMVSEGQVFEIKLAGQPKKDWTSFLLQLFAYAAIMRSKATQVHLVLPLHEHVWSFDLADWPKEKRKEYLEFLEAAAVKAQTSGAADADKREALFEKYKIGLHVEKKGGFVKSIASLNPEKPWQIFLSSNRSTRVNVKQEEIDAGSELLAESGHRVFVHAPYLINLACDPEADAYNVKCLTDTLEAAAAIGCRGVVVHVGKYTKQDPADALDNMETNLRNALEAATEECPILLETPAGQGTELLCKHDEFMEFIERFDDDKRLRVCVDTCHVWAAGEDPLAYIKKVVLFHADMLKLIHFNDSEGASACCVDRHAPPGSGAIGFEKMAAIAEFAGAEGVPMLYE